METSRAAVADYGNDGDMEIAVSNMDESPGLPGHAHMNKNRLILVKTIGVRSRARCLSSNDLRVHFGLGNATRIDRMELHWPSG